MPDLLAQSSRRKTLVLLSVSVVATASLALAAWWQFTRSKAFSKDRVPPLARASMRIAPGLFMIGSLSPSAVYVVESSSGLILVDSGLDQDAHELKSEMAKLGLDWNRVRAILITHVHGDHSGGADGLRAATGATVYAGKDDAPVLRAASPREAFFSTFFMPGQELHPTTVDVELKGGESLDFGDVRVTPIACPGHTPGSICYLFERNDYRAFFAGDVIMMLRGDDPPRTELGKPLGTYSAYLAPYYRGNARTFLESLLRLQAMPVPDLVLPGHPRADVTPESPCLSQERWQSLLGQGIGDLKRLIARYDVDGANFLDGTPRQLLPDLYYLGEFEGFAVYGLFASSKFFLVDAPGGAGLSEFVNARLKQLGHQPATPAGVLLTSSDPAATAGLKALVARYGCSVVASAQAIEHLERTLPTGTHFIPAEDLPGKDWFPVVAIELRGRGLLPVAYELSLKGKTVLFSGKIPQMVTQETGQHLIAELTGRQGDIIGYTSAVRELAARKPDLWLPAVPTNRQNANLYDRDWEKIIEDNVMLINLILSSDKNR